MAGPLLTRLMDRFDVDKEEAKSLRDQSPLLDNHADRLKDEMDSGGGCCGAMTAARAVRSDEQEYR